MEEVMEKHDGYLHVAEFVTVVTYDKKEYPNGVKKFKVKQKEEKPAESADS